MAVVHIWAAVVVAPAVESQLLSAGLHALLALQTLQTLQGLQPTSVGDAQSERVWP